MSIQSTKLKIVRAVLIGLSRNPPSFTQRIA